MKKLSLLLLAAIFAANIFSQEDARNGWRMPTRGVFRVFCVFAELSGDPNYSQVIPNWTAGQIPDNPDRYIDHAVGGIYNSFVSRYADEISFGSFQIIGDYYPQLIQIPYNTAAGTDYTYQDIHEKLKSLCNGQQLTTTHGFQFPNDFDNWNLGNSRDNVQGLQKQNIPDGDIDCIIALWRINSRLASGGGLTWHQGKHPIVIANKAGVSTYGYVYSDDESVLFHEIIHGVVGPSEFHAGAAGTGLSTFLQDYSGYSILSGNYRYMPGYNGWDRYRHGWKNPQHQYEISARSENGQEINTDLDYTQQTGDSVTYILRDFASTGDAVRIKLPYIRTLNSSAKEQWIWIENHQLLPGKVEYEDHVHGANSPMLRVPRGIYLNMQVGSNDFSAASYNNNRTNYISPINKFGKFDFTAYAPTINILGSATVLGECSDDYANPFTGVGLASFHPYDINNDNRIERGEEYRLGKIIYNDVELSKEHFRWLQSTTHGSVFDAYYQGDKISISTNPTPATWLTYEQPLLGLHTTPRITDNRKIYLNGLSIRVVEQRANGDIKICIRWKDYDIKNNVRWCGDIVLNEKINLLSGNTILLDQGLTPVRPNNPISFNGKQIFASPTIFTCMQGSSFKANKNSVITLKNNSTLIAESGSEIELDSAALEIVSGSTLHIKSGATLRIKGSGNIQVKNGSFLCIEQGANVILQDYNSAIKMEQEAVYGTNPAYQSSATCNSTIAYSGSGSIIDLSQDVYIQDEVIANSRYIGGRNIYVGHHVTTSKPQGDVLIKNGNHIIFDAAENVLFESGFEVEPGGSFEVK